MSTSDRFLAADYRDIDWQRVESVTVVCFPSGSDAMIMVQTPAGYRLPSDHRLPGEDVLLGSALRIPLQAAGFRRQGTHVAGVSHDHRQVVLWVDGSRYHGTREHQPASWWTGPASAAARLLRSQGDTAQAAQVELAERHRRTITDEQLAEDSRRLLDAAYLGAGTAEGGSGFGGTPQEWRQAREQICDAIERDGSSSTSAARMVC